MRLQMTAQQANYPTRVRSDFLNGQTGNDLQATASRRAAKSGAVGAQNEVPSVPDDPRLLWLIDAWPGLSEETRDAIARLAGDDVDDLAGVTATPDREAVS